MGPAVRGIGTWVALLAVGCGGADQAAAVGEVPPERWSLVETARIGSVDGADDALTRVGAFLPMPGGGAWFVEPVERRVRTVDGAGGLSGSVGGPGQGPGEFTIPGTMGWWNGSSDTIWVSDEFAGTISLFDKTGTFLRSIRMEPVEWNDEWVVTQPRAIGPGGVGLGLAQYRPGAEAGGPFPLVSFEVQTGGPIAQLASIPGTDRVQIWWQGETVATGAHPLPDTPIVAYSPKGMVLSVVGRSVAAVDRNRAGGQGVPEVVVTALNASGDTLWERSIGYEPERVPPSELNALWAREIEAFQRFVTLEGRLTSEEAERAYLESVPQPASRPPISAVRIDATGRLLLIWSAEPEAASEAWLLGADGGLIASFSLPVGVTVLGFEGEELWLLEVDDLDIPFVVRMRLEGA